jgi:hypothetical protein
VRGFVPRTSRIGSRISNDSAAEFGVVLITTRVCSCMATFVLELLPTHFSCQLYCPYKSGYVVGVI